MVDAGFLSIIPPIVAIVLALVTKEWSWRKYP